MEKFIFKNMYVNTVIGVFLVLVSLLGYFLGWIEDSLPYFIGAILLLLSLKRFLYSFKKTVSKNATLILLIEFILDLVFIGLLLYLQDNLNIFIGLVIYIRGVSYLLINYIATRKIRIVQYLMNIGYLTLGAYLMFASINSELILELGIAILILIVGAVFLQAGISALVKKEEQEEAREQKQKEDIKNLKKKQKAELKGLENNKKDKEKIEKLEDQVKQIKQDQKDLVKKVKETEKQVVQVETIEQEPKLSSKTVVELKSMAKEQNIAGYSSMTKAELIEKLSK